MVHKYFPEIWGTESELGVEKNISNGGDDKGNEVRDEDAENLPSVNDLIKFKNDELKVS